MTYSDIKKIVIHHSLTKDGQSLSWKGIRNYHMGTNGWSDIGYHYGIEMIDGSVEILVGRSMSMAGAHAPGANNTSLGICIVGNFEESMPDVNIWIKASFFVRDLLKFFKLPIDAVVGHRDVTPGRTCPGRHFDMDKFRTSITEAF